MRCVVRLAVVALAIAVAVIVHVVFIADVGGGQIDPLYRPRDDADGPLEPPPRRTGDILTKVVVNAHKFFQRENASRSLAAAGKQDMIPKAPVVINAEYKEALRKLSMNQSAKGEDSFDELHGLYQMLRRDPESVPKEIMMAQKITFIKILMCGSQSVINPMATVAIKNVPSLTLTMVPENTTRVRGLGYRFNERLVFEYLYRYPIPYLSVGGHRFVNFRRYADFQPISFAVLADPVERFTNMFYFVRNVYRQKFKSANASGNLRLQSDALKTTLETCVALVAKRQENPKLSHSVVKRHCGFEIPSLASVMCGEDKRCSAHANANYTLREALRNLDDFLVVGFTDQLETTVRLMEKLLPFYLRGYRQEFMDQYQLNSAKRAIPPAVTEKLRRVLQTDYALYDEARKRFGQLTKEMGI